MDAEKIAAMKRQGREAKAREVGELVLEGGRAIIAAAVLVGLAVLVLPLFR